MLTWTRAKRRIMCGRCGTAIDVGDPQLEITIGQITKYRCKQCEEAPPDLPRHVVEYTPDPSPPMRFSHLLPLDWKTRSAGVSREPGEEG